MYIPSNVPTNDINGMKHAIIIPNNKTILAKRTATSKAIQREEIHELTHQKRERSGIDEHTKGERTNKPEVTVKIRNDTGT